MNNFWDNDFEDEIEIECKIVKETEKAIYLGDPYNCWIPKSQTDYFVNDIGKLKSTTITIPYWLAREKDLI